MISLSRFFHSPASPEEPPWAKACNRRITSGVIVIRPFREKIQSSAVRYPASYCSERSRDLARPSTRGRNRFAVTVMPSILFDDSVLWMIACSRNTSRTSGFCLIPEVLLSACLHAGTKKPGGSNRGFHLGQLVSEVP